MKKILTLMLLCLLAAVMTVGTLAAAPAGAGAFVSSPSGKLAPVLVEAENEDDACMAEIVITAYADRATLGEAGAAAMLAAYQSIAGTEDLSSLNPALGELAEELGIPATDLSVSDLFDVSYTDCDGHEVHGAFTVTVRPASADNACTVIHYVNGEWQVLSTEVKDGTVTFVTEDFSPFAIVSHAGLPAPTPSNLPLIIGLCAGGVGVVAAFFIIIILLKKKKEDEEDTSANASTAEEKPNA